MISLRSLLSDVNIMPKIACHFCCDTATITNDAVDSIHADTMFILGGLVQINEIEITKEEEEEAK